MVRLGKIKQFDPTQEEWPQSAERLDQFFEANNLTGDGKAAKRRHWSKLLCSLLSPDKPSDRTFEELAKKLADHYNPAPSEVIRFRFN